MKGKKITALAILISSAAISVWLIASPGKIEKKTSLADVKENTKKLSANLLFPPKLKINSEPISQKAVKTAESDNLTDLLVQDYMQEIINRNPAASQNNSQLEVPSVSTLQSIIQEKVVRGLNYRRYELGDLRISEDTSPENQIAYIKAIDKILKKYTTIFGTRIDSAFQDFFERGNNTSLSRIVDNIPPLINELLVTSPPKNFAAIHLSLLNLWQKKSAAYQAILNTEIDPLKAYIALNQLLQIFEEDINIQTVLDKSYRGLIKT